MELLSGQVKKVIYTNDENAYTVLSVAMPDGEEEILVGYIPFVSIGENIEAQGSYKNHKQYGRQFFAETISFSVPTDKKGIISYLGGGMFKGVGKQTAEKIYAKFGDKVFEVLESDFEALSKVDGLTKKRARDMISRYKDSFTVRTVVSELANYGIHPYKAAKVYRIYGVLSDRKSVV